MEVISIHRAQVFQRFVPDEVRGERDFYVPRLYELAQKKYGFITASDIAKVPSEGAKFRGGHLEHEGREIVIESLEIYTDGIIAICRSTPEGDVVIDDAIEWAIEAFGLRRPKTILPRAYTSWIIADFDSSISAQFRNFGKLQRLIADSYEEASGNRLDFEVARLSFAVDSTTLPQYTNTEYLFDRRTATPFSQNRFFCGAPLRTEAHIELLNKLEALLGG